MAIARFSVIKMGLLMLINLAAIGSIAVSYYHHQLDGPFWPTVHPHPESYLHQFRDIALSLLCVMFIFLQVKILTFARGVAVLIADGVLFYTNFNRSFFFCRANLREIDSFSVAPQRLLRPPAVAIHFRDGRRDYIPTIFLTEPPEAILPRLSAALA